MECYPLISNKYDYIEFLKKSVEEKRSSLDLKGNDCLEKMYNDIKYWKYSSMYMVDEKMNYEKSIELFENKLMNII